MWSGLRGGRARSSAGSFTHRSGPWAESLESRGLELRGVQGLLSPWDLSTQSLQHRASEELTPVKAT